VRMRSPICVDFKPNKLGSPNRINYTFFKQDMGGGLRSVRVECIITFVLKGVYLGYTPQRPLGIYPN